MLTNARNVGLSRMFVALSACLLMAAVADAAASKDRVYRFGDDPFELPNTVGQAPSGSGGPFTSDSFAYGANDFHELGYGGAGMTAVAPKYVDTDATGGSSRPGAGATEWGLTFDGVDDRLFIDGVFSSGPGVGAGGLGIPSQADGQSQYANAVNWAGINNRVMGGWVRPTGAAAVGRQDIISDTSQFTIFISAPDAGIRYWGMTHGDPNVNDNDVIVVSDSAVNFNAWAHVSQVSYSGDAVLYVNGMAVTHTTNNSDTTPEDDANNNYNFVFGAGVDKVSNFYAGEVDDWEFSVFGNNTGNAGPPLGQNWGNIDLAVDNDFIRQALIGKPLGDVNRNGVTDAADLTLFKLNWLSEKTINGFRVGDLSTRDVGDLNIDGIVNLADAVILRNGLIAAGSGAAFDLGDLVPEPGSMFLAVFGLMSVAGMRRRRG